MTGNRRSIRAPEYDYTQPGAYFVTICTQHRDALFGQIHEGEMRLNPFGLIVCEEWLRTEKLRPNVTQDAFVVTPNHVHGILIILEQDVGHGRATEPVAPTRVREQRLRRQSVGSIVGQFKSSVVRRINRARGTTGAPVWQRNYYKHIIRTDRSLERIRDYINRNPSEWALDRYYAEGVVSA